MTDRRTILKGIAAAPGLGLASVGTAAFAQNTEIGMMPVHGAMPSWADQMEALKPVADALIKQWDRPNLTEAERQDMSLLALAMLSQGYLCHVYMDPNRPVWSPLWNMAFNQGGPNPDYIYGWTEVDPTGVYRISGFRGTSRFVNFAQNGYDVWPHLADMRPTGGLNDLDQLKHGPDGYFSVILSAERPAGYTGDWWKLYPVSRSILLRRCAVDWRNEIDARIAIERVDPATPATPEEVSRRFSELPRWIVQQVQLMMDMVKRYRIYHPTNGLKLSSLVQQGGGLSDQHYYDGIYQIEDDEALVVETDLPKKVRYWQILVADDRFCTVDWFNRQSSLNDLQAKVDGDGKLRVVVSKHDPGVANWLDKADNRSGILQMRFNQASDAPVPKVTRCLLSQIGKYLPADTPRVTADQRRATLLARREAAQFRRFW